MNLQQLAIDSLGIMRKLDEPMPPSMYTHRAIIYHLHTQGAATMDTMTQDAIAIAQNGGMMRRDGKPRTTGGIFFQLAYQAGWERQSYKIKRRLTRWQLQNDE